MQSPIQYPGVAVSAPLSILRKILLLFSSNETSAIVAADKAR